MINNIKKDDISFISTIPGLEDIQECVPKPISKYIPDWWKSMPTENNNLTIDMTHFGNAKICPSFADYFSNGYVMPMWVDTIIYYDSSTNTYKWKTADKSFEWDTHLNRQYLDHVNHKFLGKDSYFVFKTLCPWMIFSESKYMMYQLPTFFNFNPDFSVIPGVRDISVYNVMNIQFLIHSDKKEIFIERGTPIAHFIPFKKEKINYEVRGANDKDIKKINAFKVNEKTKFFKTYKKDKR